ncbi:translocating chain-associated membrane protein 1-like isoform X1 [Vespa mandarinia]|uniref:translocating chain-associated membrane protein 1-like isoform X1 n=1 Tax=Vespa mandarinia TaxID=7446 RepID=UPI00160F430D|nr:translocating chain-associated membrane protein 1-like isoform X1 [Vespa mandarinia]
MVAIKGRKNSNKNPPIFSHEFIIQNHADIVSCIAMIFVIGLMVQVTSPWAYTFIAIHHNISTATTDDLTLPQKYTIGWKDACAVFFYFLIIIVMHAVFQEYIFDKISKRLHLSKVKLAKFNESSQLVLFYLLSVIWGIDIIIRDNLLLNITSLWLDYPILLSFSLKLFFIGQLSYWLHCYPELYFQRIKKEDIAQRVIYTTVGLFFTFTAYFLNFQQVGIILFVLHYTGDVLLHGARINHFVNQKENVTRIWFLIANSIYVFVHIASLVLTFIVFFYGFNQIESSFDYSTGNFNIPIVQYTVLSVIIFFQIYLLHKFVMRQIKRARENTTPVITKIKPKQKLKKKEGKKTTLSEDDELPEVDQATKKNLRSRSSTKAK